MAERLTQEQLEQRLSAAAAQVAVGAIYKHYKGDLYKVIDLVIMTESDDEVGVVYQAQYGAKILFVRPIRLWGEDVTYQGKVVRRFVGLDS